ncbi:TPA: hypothetical protein ACUT80_004679 [Pseudomonas aeruginosa]|nr:hypothetical protein [Pseudomonas aeruginosa]HBO9777634.1 hypothetical protein [Pseudomonas aeruginosa]
MTALQDEREGFFTSTNVQNRIREVLLRLDEESYSKEEDFAPLFNFTVKSLTLMLEQGDKFDSLCKFNIKNIGDALLRTLTTTLTQKNNKDKILLLLPLCYRFLSEFDFNQETDASIELLSTLNSIRYREKSLPADIENAIRYAELFMPARILKEASQDPNLSSIREFNKNVHELPKLKAILAKDLDEREKRVTDLRTALDQYKQAFNFIGLYEGFNSLANKKRLMAWLHVAGLLIIGTCMLLPATLKLYYLIESGEYLKADLTINIQLLISIAAIELLLLYFFRVVLQSLKSIRGQLLQLDLRRSICRFIQSYAEYASEINNTQILARFEALIFSGIVAQEDNIPSTFDGIEHITKLIDSVRR